MSRYHTTPPSDNPFLFLYGDVQIQVTYKRQAMVGMVCSQSMAHVSLVWNKFLFPLWDPKAAAPSSSATPLIEPVTKLEPKGFSKTANKERLSSEQNLAIDRFIGKQIDFSEDDGEALLVLLNIAHHKYKEVPIILPYDKLFETSILIDEYQCIETVFLWLELFWSENRYLESLRDDQEGWLFIAWVFSYEETLANLAVEIIKRAKLSNGCLLRGNKPNDDPDRFFPEPMPTGFLRMMGIRHETAQKLLDIIYSQDDRDPHSKSRLQRYINANIFGFSKVKMLIRKEPEELDMSLQDLACKICQLSETDILMGGGREENNSCAEMLWRVENKVKLIMRDIPHPVSEAQRKHLRRHFKNRRVSSK